jgi:alkyl sulfatase BDS1-like metallo-beta-lactamase superfamily hydrolase
MDYVRTLDNTIQLKPEFLILSHVKPVIGTENVMNILVSTRDATQYVYDQTIRGINNGHTIDEISTGLMLSPTFERYSWLTYQKEQIPWDVKQIYYSTIGWFEGDPAFLQVNLDTRSSNIVGSFGGTENTLLAVKNAIENGKYEWAAELATYVLHVDPENMESKLLKAHALRVIAQQMFSNDGRHWALTTALELEEKITIPSDISDHVNSEQIMELPIEKILNILPTKLDVEKNELTNESLNVYFTDINEWYTLHIIHDILVVTKGTGNTPSYEISLDVETFKKILLKQLTVTNGINSEQIKDVKFFQVDPVELELFFDAFEPLINVKSTIR